jgi:DNA-binding winged helix-turn-helix (wHTH) protein/Tfp pilus assembly protein PilF/TolB-like protein
MNKCTYAFSDFTFDTTTGTLTRKNRKQRLPEQSARLLEILLEQANELVTREKLRDALWPDEEFLDYDQGINTAINRLRNALREGSRSPQFIRTIPKRGYSFHADVSVVIGKGRQAKLSTIISQVAQAEESNSIMPPSKKSQDDLPSLALVFNASRHDAKPLGGEGRNHLARWWPFAIALILAMIVVTISIARLRSLRAFVSSTIRLGVAPLQVYGDAQSQELGESFRLDITDAVSRLPGVQVRAASSFEPTRRNAINIPSLSRELNLDELLLGSIVQQGTAYDLKFELVRAEDAIHLATFEYSGTRQDLASIRDRLQNDLFHYLQSRTTTVQTINGSTNNAQAYEFYLQGTYHSLDRSPESLNQALKDFQEAIAQDPNFASAYAGMATAYLKLSAYDIGSDDISLRKAQYFARQAIRQDPLLARAHAVLGYSIFTHEWNFTQGETELRNAIRIDPTQADYRDWLAVLLTDEGRFDEGLQQLVLAHASDPHWASVYAMEGLMAGYARRPSVAIPATRTYLRLMPNLPISHNTMAWTYFKAGRYKEAIAEWRQMALLQNDEKRVALEDKGMDLLKKKGIRAYARLRLDAIKSKKGIAQKNDFIPVEWYACAGDHEEVMTELERMASSHDPFMLALAVNPLFDSFHRDPRFLTLLAKVGLTLPQSLLDSNSHLCEENN